MKKALIITGVSIAAAAFGLKALHDYLFAFPPPPRRPRDYG